MTKSKLLEIFGWYGALAVLSAYFLVSFNLVSNESIVYQLLNATGAIGLLAIAAFKVVKQAVLVNAVWFLIALVALANLGNRTFRQRSDLYIIENICPECASTFVR